MNLKSVVLISLMIVGNFQCNSQHTMNTKYTNHLINESSPYLLLHAHNPVDWYPWNQDALNKAKKENKLIIVSIGYTACHWCHVMEKQSFADQEVAELMNKHFISIKVDREERPDLDQVYMDACHLLNKSGGWPLNAIALPDGRPIYAGTYFPKDNWMSLLKRIQEYWEKEPKKLIEQAESISQGIKKIHTIEEQEKEVDFSQKDVQKSFESIYKNVDFKYGGQHGAPKFPMPSKWNFVLNYGWLNNSKDAKKSIEVTLEKMAMGGIYDHIGGGFARYSVDSRWHVPHFEKMLYDNTQLISLYSKAYRTTQNELYKDVVAESIKFIERELKSKSGGFYASLDADSEGEEGTFYVWKENEFESAVEHSDIIIDFYNVTQKGNWERGKNVLYRDLSYKAFSKQYDLTEIELRKLIEQAKIQLYNIRNKRERPATDDKILCAWNALMLSTYLDAYIAFGKKKYYRNALELASFMKEVFLKKDYRLDRNFKNGNSNINAFLDDYAFMIKAFLDLYQVNFKTEFLNIALQLTKYVNKHFYNKESGYYYYTSDLDPELISRTYEISDNVIPASNSQMAHNLIILGKIFSNQNYESRGNAMLKGQIENIISQGSYYSNWADMLQKQTTQFYEVVIIGNNWKKQFDKFKKSYLPNVIFVCVENEIADIPLTHRRKEEGKTMIYVCKNKVCNLPVESAEDALNQILNSK